MRKIKESEAYDLLKQFHWGTLCTITPDYNPYAIEYSYFLDEEQTICGIVNPKGQTSKNIAFNPEVCFKVCDTDKINRQYRAISCFGKAYYDSPSTQEGIVNAWKQLARSLSRPEDHFKGAYKRFQLPNRPLPLLKIKVERITGVTNYRKNINNDKKEE